MKALLALYDSQYIGRPAEGLPSISYNYVPANATTDDIATIVRDKGVRVVEHYGDDLSKRGLCCTVTVCNVEVIKICVSCAKMRSYFFMGFFMTSISVNTNLFPDEISYMSRDCFNNARDHYNAILLARYIQAVAHYLRLVEQCKIAFIVAEEYDSIYIV